MQREEVISFMESTHLQSLQYLATTRVAINVCESEDVQHMLGRFKIIDGNGRAVGYSDGQWRQLCGKVKRKLSEISVPDLIIDIVLENLWPISFEISKWIIYHVEDTGINCSSNFFWTPQGSIDYAKTAEILVRNEALDIGKRFKLACIYCLEPEVRSLWEQMGLSEKRSFFVRGNLKNSNKNPIVLYWTYYIQEVPIDYWDCYALKISELFKYAAGKGYLTATKFFLGKLRLNLRSRLFYNYVSNVHNKLYQSENVVKDHLAIACLLVCQTSWDYPAIDIFGVLIARYFLEWPMQRNFMSVVDRIGNRLFPRTFEELLEEILKKDLEGFRDHNYKELFKEFWLQGSARNKTQVRTESGVGYRMLLKFVKNHFGFVFDESSFAMKAKFRAIVLQREISEDETYFEKENVEFFKFLVQELLATTSSVDRFSERNSMLYLFQKNEREEFFNLPLGELKYLISGILENV